MARPERRRPDSDVVVACIIPLGGPAGIYGPSCEACISLAVHEINGQGGLLGGQVRVIVVDGSAPPHVVAAVVGQMIDRGEIDAVTGWHISPVRRAVARQTRGRIPYVYGPLHEGAESTPGVFLTGETPRDQLLPAMSWMSKEMGVGRWLLVGNDYIWPRVTAAAARDHAARVGAPLVGEVYVPLGTEDFDGVLRRVESSGVDGVISLLVGHDGVQFNRQFAERGLSDALPRLSPHVEESMLLAAGADSNRGLFSAAGYFEDLNTTDGLEFAGRYYHHLGPEGPALNSIGESCYEAMLLLATLVRSARTLAVGGMIQAASGLLYEGPRGVVQMAGNQLRQTVYVAEASETAFDIRATLRAC